MFDTFRRHYDNFSNADAVAAFVAAWLASTGARVKGGLLSTAWKEPADAGGAAFLLGRLLLTEEVGTARRSRRYPTVRLEERWLERDQLVRFLTDCAGGNSPDALPEPFHNVAAEQLFSLHAPEVQSGWAEIQLKLTSRSNRVTPEWVPAVAPELPPFQSWAHAATSWVLNRPGFYGDNVPYNGQLVVVLPDTRARPGALMSGSDGAVLIGIESNDAFSHLELQYLFTRSHSQLDQGSVEFRGGSQVAIPRCPEATKLDVFCLHREAGIVSHRTYSWDELRAAGLASEFENDDIRTAVAGGENETVEFKPFVSPDSEKRQELVRTVVAFSNGNGGRIFVGVNDHGELEGSAALKRFRSSGDRLGLETLLNQLRKLIHDQIKPVPNVTVRPYELAGEPIAIIEVPAGDFIYATHANEILIRKGSTNRRPDPATELEPLRAQRNTNGRTSSEDDLF